MAIISHFGVTHKISLNKMIYDDDDDDDDDEYVLPKSYSRPLIQPWK